MNFIPRSMDSAERKGEGERKRTLEVGLCGREEGRAISGVAAGSPEGCCSILKSQGPKVGCPVPVCLQ